MQKFLGYRLFLERGVFKKALTVGEKLIVELRLSNSGWAAPFQARDAQLILRGTVKSWISV